MPNDQPQETLHQSDDPTLIAEFLLARITEDEVAAKAANGPRWKPGDGNISEGGLYALEGDTEDGWAIAWFELGTANEAEDGSRQLPRWPKMPRHAHQNSVHAARHDPARVLRECEAKRRIVELHQMGGHLRGPVTDNRFETCSVCGPDSWPYVWDIDDGRSGRPAPEPWESEFGFYPCDTLKFLAAVYSDHPDYRDEWRP